MKETHSCRTLDLGLEYTSGSSHVYDMIWSNSHSKKAGMEPDRKQGLLHLLHPVELAKMLDQTGLTWDDPASKDQILSYSEGYDLSETPTVVDFGAGMGAYSTAAAEFGAKKVYMLDGSRCALDGYEERLYQTKNLGIPAGQIVDTVTKCHIDLNNPAKLIRHLDEQGKADLVFSRYVIMHTSNPYMALYNMTRMCNPGAVVAFNIFLKSAVSPMIRAERKFIKCFPWKIKQDLFRRLGKFNAHEAEMTVEEFLDGAGPDHLSSIRDVYNKYIVSRFDLDDIVKDCFHIENSTTPYIHTPQHESIVSFLRAMNVQLNPGEGNIIGALKASNNTRLPDEFWSTFIVTEETLAFERDQVPCIEMFGDIDG